MTCHQLQPYPPGGTKHREPVAPRTPDLSNRDRAPTIQCPTLYQLGYGTGYLAVSTYYRWFWLFSIMPHMPGTPSLNYCTSPESSLYLGPRLRGRATMPCQYLTSAGEMLGAVAATAGSVPMNCWRHLRHGPGLWPPVTRLCDSWSWRTRPVQAGGSGPTAPGTRQNSWP